MLLGGDHREQAHASLAPRTLQHVEPERSLEECSPWAIGPASRDVGDVHHAGQRARRARGGVEREAIERDAERQRSKRTRARCARGSAPRRRRASAPLHGHDRAALACAVAWLRPQLHTLILLKRRQKRKNETILDSVPNVNYFSPSWGEVIVAQQVVSLARPSLHTNENSPAPKRDSVVIDDADRAKAVGRLDGRVRPDRVVSAGRHLIFVGYDDAITTLFRRLFADAIQQVEFAGTTELTTRLRRCNHSDLNEGSCRL